MNPTSTSPDNERPLTHDQVARAMKLTYVQMMLNAVFGASTGGMFLIGFAMQLGADNILLGMMSTVPQLFVVFQLLSAFLVERGVSRKKLTLVFSILTPLCWLFIAVIPFFADRLSLNMRLAVLIGVIALVTLFAHLVGNARSSWIGELIPTDRRGRFFGNCALFGGIVGTAFAIIEGRFLDYIRAHGLFAFAALFFFGAVFGVASALMNLPQPDCPLPVSKEKRSFARHLKSTFKNRPFVALAIVHAVIALGGIAGPFSAAYCLRDLGIGFFGLGLLNSISTATVLLSSRMWGRIVDRHGGRPVLIIGLLVLAPCALVWLFIPPGHARMAYLLLPVSNAMAGIGSAALNVSLSALVYRMSKPEGRSVQFALYSIFVACLGAPMPWFGGWLVSFLAKIVPGVDLRLTFYLWMVFIFLAAILAKRLHEPASVSTRTLVFSRFPNWLVESWENIPVVNMVLSSLSRLPASERRTDSAGVQDDANGSRDGEENAARTDPAARH